MKLREELEQYRNKNWTKKLQPKLTLPVLVVVAVTFFMILIFCTVYYQNSYKEREISNQKNQMDKVVYGISTMQSTVENVAKQIVISEAVQGDIRYPVKTSAEYFVTKNNIQNALGTYSFIMDYIQEVLIYTKEGDSYSSSQFRDKFQPEKEEWYTDFKQTGEKKGYTKVHTATISQNGRTGEVISYVLTYYSLSDERQELGDLIISLDYDAVQTMTEMDMTLVQGYTIYDSQGEQVLGSGELGLSYEELTGTGRKELTDGHGNIYLISDELENGWIMVTEISGNLLQSQVLAMETVIVGAFVLLAVLIVVALSHNIRKVVEPINRLSLAAEQVGTGNFDVEVQVNSGDEVEILANAFNKMAQDVRHYTEMSVEHEKIIRRSQVDQLLLQINPHFIYNTLNSIVYMARTEGSRDIEEFVNAFISLLQATLHVENEVNIPLGEELNNVENYLILQKYRYQDKFDSVIECPDELKNCMVPKVILQPIVENAIFHGIAPLENKGKLRIQVEQQEEKLKIIIQDNGIGMDAAMVEQLFDDTYVNSGGMRKIGVANVYHRIREICGEEYGFTIESEVGKGTRVIIYLPITGGE